MINNFMLNAANIFISWEWNVIDNFMLNAANIFISWQWNVIDIFIKLYSTFQLCTL